MASRYEIRSIIVQSLFEADFRDSFNSDGVMDILKRNVRDELELDSVPEFAETITLGVILKKDTLDEIIVKAAPEWPINKISIIDRTILRLGLFELLFGATYNIPQRVAINEAIELAKAFGGDSSRKFVNGVLGSIYREINPGEAKPSKKEVSVISLAGGLVFTKSFGEVKIALVHDMFKYWTLPKGKMEGVETIEDCAKREVKEEIGVEINLISKIQENEYIANNEETSVTKKHVTYFLAEAITSELKLEEGHTGILDVKWFTVEEYKKLKVYKDVKIIIEKGLKQIPE